MTESEDLSLDNIDEFVNDEHKRVTYKWLSLSLSLHVNQAKLLLYKFVDQQRNKKDNDTLSVTYALSGLVEDNGGLAHKVQVVPEEKLEAAKSQYKVLTTCHIYSVQKGPVKDCNTLYMTDYDAVKQNMDKTSRLSAIQCSWAEHRSEQQMEQFVQVKGSHATLIKPPVKAEPAKPSKPTGIAGMFSKSAAKPTKEKETAQPEKKPSPEANNSKNTSKGKGKPPGVASFFGKQAAKPAKDNSESSVSLPEKPEASEVTKDSHKSSSKPEDTQSSPSDTKRGVKHKVDDDDQILKQSKRKRVKVQIESSSEDEAEDVDMASPEKSPAGSDPDMIPPSPDQASKTTTEKSSPEKSSPEKAQTSKTEESDTCGKIRKRQLVSKTFVNEEGFMVTEKTYKDVWEDAPKETKTTPKKEVQTNSTSVKAKSPKKVSPTSKKSGKQTSLMNFFKKK